MLSWDGISQPATIRNISPYGALLCGAYLPAVGTRVTLIAERLEVCGTVIWLHDDRCGLLLSREVQPLEIVSEAPVRTVGEHAGDIVTLERAGPNIYI